MAASAGEHPASLVRPRARRLGPHPHRLRPSATPPRCALGAILFYLLTGEVEGGRRSAALAIERAFKEAQPQHLSAAGITDAVAQSRGTPGASPKRILGGDIDTIVAAGAWLMVTSIGRARRGIA